MVGDLPEITSYDKQITAIILTLNGFEPSNNISPQCGHKRLF